VSTRWTKTVHAVDTLPLATPKKRPEPGESCLAYSMHQDEPDVAVQGGSAMVSKRFHVVTGAFGYSGKYIAQRLLDEGCEVRTLTDSTSRRNPFGGKVRAHPFCFDEPERLVSSLRGARVLYNTYWVRFNHTNSMSRLQQQERPGSPIGCKRTQMHWVSATPASWVGVATERRHTTILSPRRIHHRIGPTAVPRPIQPSLNTLERSSPGDFQ